MEHQNYCPQTRAGCGIERDLDNISGIVTEADMKNIVDGKVPSVPNHSDRQMTREQAHHYVSRRQAPIVNHAYVVAKSRRHTNAAGDAGIRGRCYDALSPDGHDNTSTSNTTTFPLPNHPGRERTGENESPTTTVFLDDRLPSRIVQSSPLTVGDTLTQQPEFIRILPDGPRHVVQGVIMPVVVVIVVATAKGSTEGIVTRHVEL